MGSFSVSNLGKAYKYYPTRWARLAEWLLPFSGKKHQLKWILRDINFSVSPGEAVGIIGINGAGKSTLLKLITGTSQPTTGIVAASGRVAALLELGMGFHPDFTGRQNAYMAGQLLGMSGAQINTLMPDIEAFAEIGDYIDQPVRMYSSGMQMRLAFSVATAVRPDILIVDEALSVGDAYFQHKSFERIRSYSRQGTTLLLVSHDRSAIQSICDRVVLLDAGNIVKDGPPEAVLDFYNAMLAARENSRVEQSEAEDGRLRTTSGTGEATVSEIKLLDNAGKALEMVGVGEPVTLSVKVHVKAPLPRMVFGYVIKDRWGQQIYGTNTHHLKQTAFGLKAGDAVEYKIQFPANLGPGEYSIATALTGSETHLTSNYEWRDLALLFTVVNIDKVIFTGCTWLEPTLNLEIKHAAAALD